MGSITNKTRGHGSRHESRAPVDEIIAALAAKPAQIIADWVPGHSSMRSVDKDYVPEFDNGRWEFVGKIAADEIRKKYLGKSVSHYFARGAQNPIKYLNC